MTDPITPKQLAAELGVAPRTIRQWLRDHGWPVLIVGVAAVAARSGAGLTGAADLGVQTRRMAHSIPSSGFGSAPGDTRSTGSRSPTVVCPACSYPGTVCLGDLSRAVR